MQMHTAKTQAPKSESFTASSIQEKRADAGSSFLSNRADAVAQRKIQALANNSVQVKQLSALQQMVTNSPKNATTQLKCKECEKEHKSEPLQVDKYIVQKMGRTEVAKTQPQQNKKGNEKKRNNNNDEDSGDEKEPQNNNREGAVDWENKGCYADAECTRFIAPINFCHNCIKRQGNYLKKSLYNPATRRNTDMCFPCHVLGQDEPKQREKITEAFRRNGGGGAGGGASATAAAAASK